MSTPAGGAGRNPATPRLLAALLLAAQLACPPTVGAQPEDGRLPILRVDAADRDAAQVGEALGRAVKARFPDVERRYDTYLAGALSQDRFDRWLTQRVQPLRANGIAPEHRAEVQAVANAWSLVGRSELGDGHLSLDEFWFLQLIPDVGRHTNCSGFGVYGPRSADGGPLLGRNMDWVSDAALRGLQAITVYQDGERTLVNVGFAGYLGVITGFNDRGLFLAHLDSPLGRTYPDPPLGDRSIVFDLRRALETQDRITPAARFLARGRYGFSHDVLMADRAAVRVLEQPQGQPARLRTPDSPTRPQMAWDREDQIAAVNCYALTTTPANCRGLLDRYRWQRLRELARFQPAGPRARASDITRIMLDTAYPGYEIFNRGTVQSMVFAPRGAELYLYAVPEHGRHPDQPIMHRYHDLIPTAGEASSSTADLLPLWLLLALAAATALWARLSRE